MRGSYIFLAVFVAVASLMGCGRRDELYGDKFRVITAKVDAYERPNVLSKVVATYKYNDELAGRDKKPRFNTPDDWLEIQVAPKVVGFVERSAIADAAIQEKLKTLADSVKDKQVQASGITKKKSRFRISPERNGQLIETLKEPVKFDMYEKVVIETAGDKGPKREFWYKVKLQDGRVGYLYMFNVEFTPPGDIKMYTENRKPVSWYLLRERKDEVTGNTGRDYLVSYISLGREGIDFNRIELYTNEIKSGRYATAFARGDLKGILPIDIVKNDDGTIVFRFRQLIKDKKDKLLVQEYSFPSPIKMIREYEEDAAPVPH